MNRMNKYIFTIAALSLALDVWAQSGFTLSLERCREMSAENALEVKNAALDVSSAQALKKEAFTEYFPKISVSAMGYYAFDPMLNIGLEDVLGNSDGARNLIDAIEATAPLYGINTTFPFLDYGYMASVNVVQPLYAGGRIVNGNRLAELNRKAAVLKQSYATEVNTADVDRKYWLVVGLQEKMQSVSQAITMLDTLARDVRNAYDAGLALDTDTMKVNLERKRLQSSMTQLKSGIRLAKMDLLNAVGQEYTYFESFATGSVPWIDSIVLTDAPENLMEPGHYYVDENQAVEESERSKLLSLNVESARLQKKVALGEVLPEVGVGVGYGYGRVIGDGGNWNGAVFASVKIPLSDHWKTSSKMKRLENDAQKAENEREYLNGQLLLELRKLYEDMNTAYEQVQNELDAVALAKATEGRMMDSYRCGQATVAEVLSAQTERHLADDSLTDARIAYSNAVSEYLAKTASSRK